MAVKDYKRCLALIEDYGVFRAKAIELKVKRENGANMPNTPNCDPDEWEQKASRAMEKIDSMLQEVF